MDDMTIEMAEHYYASIGYITVVRAGKVIEMRKEEEEWDTDYQE